MKKALFALAAVLFALTVVTCTVDTPKEESNIVYKNGKPWGVELSIRDGNISRSMTGDIARLYVNYYEVAFMSDGEPTRRTQWYKGETGKLEVPFGNYAGVDPLAVTSTTGAAIMFAGYGKTLLAVGKLSPGTANITANTTSVTFELTPLLADVKGANTSAFQITTTGHLTSTYNGGDTWTLADAVLAATAVGQTTVNASDTTDLVNGQTIRITGNATRYVVSNVTAGTSFDVTPVLAAAVTAASTVEILSPGNFPRINLKITDTTPATILDLPMFYVKVGDTNEATYTVTGGGGGFPHYQGVILQASPRLTSSAIPSSVTGSGFELVDLTLTNTAVLTSGVFTFTFDVPGTTLGSTTEGLAWLSIDIPVKALNSTGGQEWHILGGMINSDYDLGAATHSLGGKILLGTAGTVVSELAQIEITSN